MFQKLMRLFEEPRRQLSESDLRLASVVLLVEVAMADHSFSSDEEGRLLQILQKQFDLSAIKARDLLDEARQSASTDVSLHRHIDIINEQYGAQEKVELMRMLWDVAFSDGELHHYEEHIIRRLGDLIYVPHREFIRTKLSSRKEN